MVDPIGIVLYHEGTKGHGLIWVELNVVFVNIKVKAALHMAGIDIKVYDDLGLFGVTHEESVRTGG